MEFPVTAEPLQIKVEAWGQECNFNHEIVAAIELTTWELVPKWDKLILLMKRLVEFLGLPLPEPEPREMEVT